MSSLHLHLLGWPRIEKDGEPLHVDTRKAIALLAFLAVTGGSHSRDTLAALLWPEYHPVRARANLRRTLSTLRAALAGGWLLTGHQGIGLQEGNGLWCDVDQFRARLSARRAHSHSLSAVCAACLPLLSEAVALWRGDFMSGLTLRDSANFDDWQCTTAEGLRRELARALEMLVQGHLQKQDGDAAMACAQQWLALDRLNEHAHACLMRLYAGAGQRTAALRQYRQCVKILSDQLGVAPQGEIVSLYEAIRDGRILVQQSRQVPALQDKTSALSPPGELEDMPLSSISPAGTGWTGTDDGADEAAAFH